MELAVRRMVNNGLIKKQVAAIEEDKEEAKGSQMALIGKPWEVCYHLILANKIKDACAGTINELKECYLSCDLEKFILLFDLVDLLQQASIQQVPAE